MKVLLINTNPAVSRMFALCTRNEDIVLDEVKGVDALKDADYDLLFVNDDQNTALLLAEQPPIEYGNCRGGYHCHTTVTGWKLLGRLPMGERRPTGIYASVQDRGNSV